MKKILFYISIFYALSSQAQWSTNSSINSPVAAAPKSQNSVHSVSDANGGIVMVWDDNRNSSTTADDIYAQRLNASGIRKWALNGIAICNNAGTQKNSTVTDAGNGNTIITWEDNRAGNYDIYAQKIDSSGNILWASNGIIVCNKTTTQKSPKIVGDNAGGAIIVWEDSLNNYWDIYAQRISSSGSVMWTSGGVAICNASNTQVNPRIDIDGAGGAIFTWQDKRNNADYDIYAQRIDASGAVQWTANGVAICVAAGTQSNPRIEPDGANGALISWVDKRNTIDNNIYAQRINSSGITQWTSNGVTVCSAANNQSALDMKYIGSTGLLITWKDDRVNANEIYAQLISLSGITQLTTNGIKLSNGLKSLSPNVISDGSGGAIVAWQDSTTLGWDIRSQKLNSSGTIQWTNGGEIVSDANDDQLYVSQVSDGNGGAIFVWDDHRNGTDYDIYAHHLYSNGTALVGINELSNTRQLNSVCYPNPINDNSVIKLTDAMSKKDWTINIYNSNGLLIETQSAKNTDTYHLKPSNYPSGIYFYSIIVADENSYSKGSFISAN